MAKNVSAEVQHEITKLRKMVGNQGELSEEIGISKQAMCEREKKGFSREHSLAILRVSEKFCVDLSAQIEKSRVMLGVDETLCEDDCYSCRLGGKGGEK